MAATETTKASDHPQVQAAHDAVRETFKTNGLLDQATKAQASGALADFFKNLWTQFSPTIVPVLISLISSLLHLTPAPVTPPAPAPAQSKS